MIRVIGSKVEHIEWQWSGWFRARSGWSPESTCIPNNPLVLDFLPSCPNGASAHWIKLHVAFASTWTEWESAVGLRGPHCLTRTTFNSIICTCGAMMLYIMYFPVYRSRRIITTLQVCAAGVLLTLRVQSFQGMNSQVWSFSLFLSRQTMIHQQIKLN